MEIKLNKFICWLIGHDWRYNFPSTPNKCMCARCYKKEMFNLTNLTWYEIDEFPNERRSDNELAKKWTRTCR